MSDSSAATTVGITGPGGFIAGHLARRLSAEKNFRVVACRRDAFREPAKLRDFVRQCDAIVHLAGKNRGHEQEIHDVNVALVNQLVEALAACSRPPHVIFASSTQRGSGTAYGRSKTEAETRLRQWASQSSAPLTLLVIPNVYGPGCRPFYNSVVATFCHQLAHGQQPVVIDDSEIEFAWIYDLVEAISQVIHERRAGANEVRIAGTARIRVSQLLAKLQVIRDYFHQNTVPDLSDPLAARLYTTFLSHVEIDDHCHKPTLHGDARGDLFEVLRLAGGGQVFFSTTRPGVIRGNHFHSRKVEWFCVVRGEAVIRMRRVGDDLVREFPVCGSSPEFISIPPLYTHHIENVGQDDLLTMFWCSESFQPCDPDTFFEKVA